MTTFRSDLARAGAVVFLAGLLSAPALAGSEPLEAGDSDGPDRRVELEPAVSPREAPPGFADSELQQSPRLPGWSRRTWLPALVVAFAVLALGVATFVLLRRASRARRELAERLHDTALALDRRCDALQDQVRTLELQQRVDHVFDLLNLGETEGRLEPGLARRLRRHALALRASALAPRT